MNLGTATVLHGNARDIPLPDNSVDLICTSPPYYALRSYRDGGEHYEGQIGDEQTPAEYIESLLDVTRDCMRVLKPSGSLWVNLGDKYAGQGSGSGDTQFSGQGARDGNRRSRPGMIPGVRGKSLVGLPWRYALRCIDDLGLILRAEVCWEKTNAMPESVTDRVQRSHEQWFHFTLNPQYFANVDPIREPHVTVPGGARRHGGAAFGVDKAGRGGDGARHTDGHPLGKLPSSVWKIATEPLKVPASLGVDHFAAFPSATVKRIVQAWCPEGGTVLDPFGGTGTTAMVAKALGRDGFSLDMSADYTKLAVWRTNDRDQLAKILGFAKVEAPAEDQLSLFDDEAAV